MKLARGPYLSMCCLAPYEENLEKLPTGQLVMLFKCAKCLKPCRISSKSEDFVSGCCGKDLQHPVVERVGPDGRTERLVRQPGVCGYCKAEQNLCVCKLGNYYECAKCGRPSNLVLYKKPVRVKVKA